MLPLRPTAAVLLLLLLAFVGTSAPVDGTNYTASSPVDDSNAVVSDTSDPSPGQGSVDPEMIIVPDTSATVEMPNYRPDRNVDPDIVWPPDESRCPTHGDSSQANPADTLR